MKIIFAGTPEFALPALQALIKAKHQICAVYTQPDRPAGRGQKLTPSPIKQFAIKNNLPVLQPESLKDPTAQKQFSAFHADILVNVAYGLLLPKPILEGTKLGCVNIHPSLLPRWRGAAPIQRAILAGDQETGVTIMHMDEGLDTGDIYKQVKIPIENTDTSATLMLKAALCGAELLITVINEIAAGTAKPIPQDSALSTYAKKITKEEAKINWQLPAVEIERMIRAFIPWPIAYSEIAGQRVRIWEAQAFSETAQATPGTIIAISKEAIIVSTSAGTLHLHKIQLPGGNALIIKDIFNAYLPLFTVGSTFVNVN